MNVFKRDKLCSVLFLLVFLAAIAYTIMYAMAVATNALKSHETLVIQHEYLWAVTMGVTAILPLGIFITHALVRVRLVWPVYILNLAATTGLYFVWKLSDYPSNRNLVFGIASMCLGLGIGTLTRSLRHRPRYVGGILLDILDMAVPYPSLWIVIAIQLTYALSVGVVMIGIAGLIIDEPAHDWKTEMVRTQAGPYICIVGGIWSVFTFHNVWMIWAYQRSASWWLSPASSYVPLSNVSLDVNSESINRTDNGIIDLSEELPLGSAALGGLLRPFWIVTAVLRAALYFPGYWLFRRAARLGSQQYLLTRILMFIPVQLYRFADFVHRRSNPLGALYVVLSRDGFIKSALRASNIASKETYNQLCEMIQAGELRQTLTLALTSDTMDQQEVDGVWEPPYPTKRSMRNLHFRQASSVGAIHTHLSGNTVALLFLIGAAALIAFGPDYSTVNKALQVITVITVLTFVPYESLLLDAHLDVTLNLLFDRPAKIQPKHPQHVTALLQAMETDGRNE